MLHGIASDMNLDNAASGLMRGLMRAILNSLLFAYVEWTRRLVYASNILVFASISTAAYESQNSECSLAVL